MSIGPRQRRVPRSYQTSGSGSENMTTPASPSSRSSRPAVAAGEILENVIADVLRAGDATGFRGMVDVQLDLHHTEVDANGFLVALLAGSDPTSASVSVKLATRVDLSHRPPSPADPQV